MDLFESTRLSALERMRSWARTLQLEIANRQRVSLPPLPSDTKLLRRQFSESYVYNKRGCCMRLCKMARFCALLPVALFYAFLFFSYQMGCKKAQICAEFCKNVQKALLCNTPFSYTPFCVSPNNPGKKGFFQAPSRKLRLGFLEPLLGTLLRSPPPSKTPQQDTF